MRHKIQARPEDVGSIYGIPSAHCRVLIEAHSKARDTMDDAFSGRLRRVLDLGLRGLLDPFPALIRQQISALGEDK